MPPPSADLLAAVLATFPDGDAAAILELLERYGSEPYEREKARVQLAIVALSGGSKERLGELVQAAKTDYRDVLAWQQLGPLSAADGERLRRRARALIAKWGKP